MTCHLRWFSIDLGVKFSDCELNLTGGLKESLERDITGGFR